MKTSTSLPLHIKQRPRKPSGAGGAPVVTENITATWNGDTLDLTPDFALDSTEFAVNDVVEERRSPSDPTVTTYTSAQATIIAVDPGTGAITLDSTFDFGGDWVTGTWYVQFWLTRASVEIGKSNIETITLTSVAPVLSLATDTATGTTTASGTVSTTGTNGTLYAVITTSSTSPSAAQVKAGQDHTGAAAVDTASQAVTGIGVQTITGGFTGLTASTAYYAHYMHENTSSQQSNVASGDGFTTDSGTSFTYAGHHARDNAGGLTSTHSVDFGTISTTRTAIIVFHGFTLSSANVITGITVASNPATKVVENFQIRTKCVIAQIDVTTGGIKSIVVTASEAIYHADVGVYIMGGYNSTATATDKHASGYANSLTLFNGSSGNGVGTQSIPSGGVMVVAAGSQYSGSISFPPATTDYDGFQSGAGELLSSAGHHSGSDIDPVVTRSTAGDLVAVGAIWGP